MKELIQDLKTTIADRVASLGGTKAVHLVIDEDLLPETTPFPCVGLKDGDVVNHYYLGMQRNKRRLSVDIICYVKISGTENGLIGKGEQKGIIDITDEVRENIEGYAPTGYHWMNGDVSETSSQTLQAQDGLVQKKKMTMIWTKG